MISRAVVRLASLASLLGVCAGAGQAHAYCRATTIENKRDDCRVCETAGYPLAWEEPDIEYVFNEAGFPTLSDREVETIFSEAFDKWQGVSCDGDGVQVDVRQAGGTTELGPRDAGIEPTVNVMGYLSEAEWSEEGFDRRAFAQTGVRYYKDSGVIAGADIWFNGGIGPFGVCPPAGCDDDLTVDLPNVATHEVGHFFGLAHSNVDDSTMACDALPGQTDKRSLAVDDRAGMCAIYPPELAFRGPYEQGEWTVTESGDSCSLRQRPADVGWLQLSIGLALVALLRTRRRKTA